MSEKHFKDQMVFEFQSLIYRSCHSHLIIISQQCHTECELTQKSWTKPLNKFVFPA